MRERVVLFYGTLLMFTAIHCWSAAEDSISQNELVSRTRELFDGVAAGKNTAWGKYFAEQGSWQCACCF